jgi:hypothetical protein
MLNWDYSDISYEHGRLVDCMSDSAKGWLYIQDQTKERKAPSMKGFASIGWIQVFRVFVAPYVEAKTDEQKRIE